jgi:predicted glycogen debranching enzyme
VFRRVCFKQQTSEENVKAFSFSANACHELGTILSKEWFERNHLGGYSTSTLLCANTRRGHGLLVTRLKKPLGEFVMLSNTDELLHIDDRAYSLSTRIYPSGIFPTGYQYVYQFTLDPFPTWIYHVEDLVIEKNIICLKEEQTVLIRYQVLSGDEDLVRLEMRPLTAFRHVKDLAHENQSISSELKRSDQCIEYAGLFFYHNAAILDQTASWYQRVYYPEDRKQGLDFEEDLYSPFNLVFAFGDHRENFFSASLVKRDTMNFQKLLTKELNQF